MLQIVNLEHSYGHRTLFKGVSFTLTPGERLALVGRNGCGKSTLFRLILDQEHPDSGEIIIPRGYRIGHLSQHLHFTEPTILREACRGLPEGSEGEEYKAEIILSGLGFSNSDFEKPAASFSGGFQIRVELARVLLSQPNLLLLDEPTNYLDIVSARWLESFLRDWENEIILISHDRTFLDAVSTHTMIIHRGVIRRVSGGTKKLYDLIAEGEAIYEQTRLNQDKKRRDMEEFINKFKAKAGTAALAQSRMKMLEKMDFGEELQDEPTLDFTFYSLPFHGKALLETESLSFAYPARDKESAPLPIVEDFSFTIGKGDRIAVIGKNGKGKSTFLRLLAQELTPTSGEVRVAPLTTMGYFGQTNIQRLSESLTVEEEISHANPKLARTNVRAICGTMMFSGDDALKKIKVLSGGERSRVLLGKLLAQPTNLLLLDEPTNHLDVESVTALVESLAKYEGAVVLVTHDEFMLRKLAKRIVLFSDDGASLIEGDYDYFLESHGWGDDDPSAPTKSKRKGKSQSQSVRIENSDGRRDRAKVRQERAKQLGPIDKEMSALEARIIALEGELKAHERALVEKSTQGNAGIQLAELSKAAAEAKRSIDVLFDKLEALSARKIELEKQFEEQ